jgi:hypothetical protein
MHRNGVSWADIGARMGQRSKVLTADIYSHALIDGREVDRAKLLERVRESASGDAPVIHRRLKVVA